MHIYETNLLIKIWFWCTLLCVIVHHDFEASSFFQDSDKTNADAETNSTSYESLYTEGQGRGIIKGLPQLLLLQVAEGYG